MKYTDFKKDFIREVRNLCGDKFSPMETKVKKVNHSLDGLTYSEENVQLAPTVYIDDLYKEYLISDLSIKDIAETVVDLFNTHRNRQMPFNAAEFTDFANVRSNLTCKIIKTDWNKELLEDVPHTDFLDLSVIYMYVCQGMGDSYITIKKDHLNKLWNISEDEFLKIAEKTVKKDYVIYDMLDLLISMQNGTETCPIKYKDFLDRLYDGHMLVTSTYDRFLGSTVLADNEFLQDIAEVAGSFLIIPSSIHEVILVKGDYEKSYLKNLIERVNDQEVSEQERLSDHAYYYNAVKKCLEVC